jgi:hypothetical protein
MSGHQVYTVSTSSLLWRKDDTYNPEDLITGDEMFSDGFPIKEVDNIVYQVDCQDVVVRETVDGMYWPPLRIKFSISCYIRNGLTNLKKDPEAMEDEEAKIVNNVVDTFKLKKTTFTKRAYLTYLKGYDGQYLCQNTANNIVDYFERIKSHLAAPDQVEEFEKNASPYAKKIVAHFKDYEFYTGQSMNAEGMIALLNFRDDGITPYFTFWKHGLKLTTLE